MLIIFLHAYLLFIYLMRLNICSDIFFIIALVSMQCCPGSRRYRMRTLFLFLFFCFRHLFINSTIQSTWVKWIPTKFQALGIWWSMEFCICLSSMYKSCQLRFSVIIMYSCLLLCSLLFSYMDDFHKVKR